MSLLGGFVCDVCRFEHPFMRDLGKTLPVEPSKHKAGQSCTGYLCRRCLYGDLNRKERRTMGLAAVCLSRHQEVPE